MSWDKVGRSVEQEVEMTVLGIAAIVVIVVGVAGAIVGVTLRRICRK